MASRRLFVAISLPDPIRSELAHVQQTLRKAVAGPSSRVRWTVPDQLHLTVLFLGNVTIEHVSDLCRSIDAACRPFGPLELSIGAIGAFPRFHAPRILLAKVIDHNGRLIALAHGLRSQVRPFVTPLEVRPFSAHVTIARVNTLDRSAADALVAAAAGFEVQQAAGWRAGQLELFESKLSDTGATHHHLASFHLTGRT